MKQRIIDWICKQLGIDKNSEKIEQLEADMHVFDARVTAAVDNIFEAISANTQRIDALLTATDGPYADWKAKGLKFPLDIPNQYGNQLALWEANLPDGWDEKDAFYLSNDKVPYEFSTFGMKVYDKMTYLGFRKKPSGQYVNGGTVVLLFDELNNNRVAAIPHEYMKLVEVVG